MQEPISGSLTTSGNPFKAIRSLPGKVLGYVGGFVLIAFVAAIAIGVANSNLFWGEANQTARIPIPGAKKVELPGGTTEGTVAVALPGRGTQIPDLLLPPLELSVTPFGEAGKATISNDLQETVNANDSYDDTSRVVWKIHAPSSGTYLVHVKGDMTGYGVNAQLWLGTQPAWIHGSDIWIAAAAVAAAVYVVGFILMYFRRRRKKRLSGTLGGWEEADGPGPGSDHAESLDTAAQRMAKLQKRHEAGHISDDEFEAKRKELEAEFMSERGLA